MTFRCDIFTFTVPCSLYNILTIRCDNAVHEYVFIALHYHTCMLINSFYDVGDFDADQAGKRMRLPIPETWETQVSLRGNKAEVWESLIGKFMRLILSMHCILMTVLSSCLHLGEFIVKCFGVLPLLN